MLLGAAAFSPAAADLDFPLQDQVLLTDIDPETDAGLLGWSVAIGDDLVAMGAPFKDAQIGAAYLYRIDGNRDLQSVREFDGGPSLPLRRYGFAMVADGDLLAVGNGGRVPVQIYRQSGNDYVLIKSLEIPDLTDQGVSLFSFGPVIDLEDGLLIVADSSATVDGVGNAGVALVFREDAGGPNNWGLEGVLKNPDGRGVFGRTAAIGNDIAVIGDNVEERALLFERDGMTWSFSGFLDPVNQNAQDRFGSSVAAEGDIIAVGAIVGNDASSPTVSGSVHIFERDAGGQNQFGEVAEVVGSQASFIDEFGASVRLRNGVLAVGSPNGNRAYLFAVHGTTNTWGEVAVVEPPPAAFIANFGRSVDYLRGSLVVGAERWDNSSLLNFGAVFLFENEVVRR
ncbi:MAG: FG-GAP repeat protein, partial [Wenzhouxiangella sp.]|nr:FG-GAP repeat protein [Wenzhouxiangella sp.]